MTHSVNSRYAILFALLLLFARIAGSSLSSQERTQLRTIRGTVVDKSESPAPSSVVYLLNLKTQAVKTYIADDSGAFHFSGLDPNTDYEVHAEKDNEISPNRTISSFDSRRDIQLTLKLSRTKSGG